MKQYNLFILDSMVSFKTQQEAEEYQDKLKELGLKSNVKVWKIPGFKSKEGGV